MDKLRQIVAESKSALKKADHLAYVTYPQVKEIKLLYLIAENIYKALTKSMEAVLYYERLYKRIPVLPGPFDYELELFKEKCLQRYNIDRSVVLLIKDLKSLIEAKKKGPVEFSRRNKFVICSNDYSMKVLDIQKVKNHLYNAKAIVERVSKVVRC